MACTLKEDVCSAEDVVASVERPPPTAAAAVCDEDADACVEEAGPAASEPATGEEVETTAGPADGSKRIRDIGGVTYPSLSVSELYHPVLLLYALFLCLSEMSSMLVPDGTFADAAPPRVSPSDINTAERKYAFGIPFAKAPAIYLVAAMGVASFRAMNIHALITLILMIALTWINGSTTYGWVAGVFSLPLWARSCKQPLFLVIYIWFFTSLSFAYLLFLRNFPTIKQAMPNAFVAGMLAPATSTAFMLVMTPLPELLVRRFGRPGLPAYAVTWPLACLIDVGDLLRLISMVSSDGAVADLASNWVASIVADLAVRSRVVPVTLHRLMGTPFVLHPSTDIYLRLRCTSSYVPVVAILLYSAFAAIASAEWARRDSYWLGLAVFVSATMLCDLAVILAHRRLAPVPGETALQTAVRISKEPRAHWPWWQPTTPPVPAQQLWAPTAIGSRCGHYADKLLAGLMIWQMQSTFTQICLYSFFGPCCVTIHRDRCHEVAN